MPAAGLAETSTIGYMLKRSMNVGPAVMRTETMADSETICPDRAANRQFADVGRLLAVGPNPQLPSLSGAVQVVDKEPAASDLERAEDVVQRDALASRLGAINVNVNLPACELGIGQTSVSFLVSRSRLASRSASSPKCFCSRPRSSMAILTG